MASFEHAGAELHYDVHGEGFPVLLIAPGGMRSAAPFWENTPWNPIEDWRDGYRVIAMDQRNAGRSRGPVSADDGWQTYTGDQLALMDHLGCERFHVAGMCIGGPYAFGLMAAAPDRVASAVLFQPIGLEDNRQAFHEMFDNWADTLRSDFPQVSDADWRSFRSNMYDGDEILFNVGREFLKTCENPLIVLCGRDLYHPESTSREIAALAPNVEFVEEWKEGAARQAARAQVRAFLDRNTPAA
jgi:pimeloyl-ACP methyl ester carboxylesterase